MTTRSRRLSLFSILPLLTLAAACVTRTEEPSLPAGSVSIIHAESGFQIFADRSVALEAARTAALAEGLTVVEEDADSGFVRATGPVDGHVTAFVVQVTAEGPRLDIRVKADLVGTGPAGAELPGEAVAELASRIQHSMRVALERSRRIG